MLNVFWDIEEKPTVKKKIETQLKALEKELLTCLENSSFLAHSSHPSVAQRESFSRFFDYASRIIFTGSEEIRKLNKNYRQKDKPTDVLSFSELDFKSKFPFLAEKNSLGEIYINYQWAQPETGNWQLKTGKSKPVTSCHLPVTVLFIHGFLHLLGFDHEKDQGEMEKLEKELRKKCISSDKYGKIQ